MLDTLPPLEQKPAQRPLQYDGFRVGFEHGRILPENIQIGRSRARQASQIVQPAAHGQPPAERHAVDVYHLKPVRSRRLLPVENISDIEVVVQNACPVQADQKSGQRFQYRQVALPENGRFRDGAQRLAVGVERNEAALPQDAAAARFDYCDLFGRVDAQITQPPGIQIGPHGLAFAQRAVDYAVEPRQTPVTLDCELHPAGLEAFDDIATVMQCLAVSHEENRVGQSFDERPEVFVFRIDEYLHLHG